MQPHIIRDNSCPLTMTMCVQFFYLFQVFVNGIQAGSHTGGYDAFSFDISHLLDEEKAEQELVVVVEDPTESQVCYCVVLGME